MSLEALGWKLPAMTASQWNRATGVSSQFACKNVIFRSGSTLAVLGGDVRRE